MKSWDLLWEAKKGDISAEDLCKGLIIPVSRRRIQQILNSHPTLQYRKYLNTTRMAPKRKEECVAWCPRYISKAGAFWFSTVFSDEKKFYLVGPDSLTVFANDLCEDPRRFSKRQAGGITLMVWAAISWYGKSSLVFLDGTQIAELYCEALETHLHPFSAEKWGIYTLEVSAGWCLRAHSPEGKEVAQ